MNNGAPASAGAAAVIDPPARAYRMLAELEEAEHGDSAAAKRALERAGFARPDETWTCRECRARATDWTPLCPSCQAFDTLEWASPRPIAMLAEGPGLRGPKASAPELAGPHLANPGLANPLPPMHGPAPALPGSDTSKKT